MQARLNPRVDPVQLRKRVLLFYFAAGVNLLMALWVGSAGSAAQTGAGTASVVTLIFIGFAGLNYFMARKLQKYLKRLAQEGAVAPPVPVQAPTEEEKK